MKIILKHIFKNIFENWFRSLLIVFSVALAAGCLYLNLNIKDDVLDQSKKTFESIYNGYSIVLENEEGGDIVLNQDILEHVDFNIDYYVANEKYICHLYRTNINNVINSDFIDYSGSKFSSLHENEALISKEKADLFNLKINDYVSIQDNEGTDFKARIIGFVDDLNFFKDSTENVLEVLCHNNTNTNRFHFLKCKDNTNIDDIISRLKLDNPTFNVSYLNSNNDEYMEQIETILVIILILVIGIAIFVVSSSIKLIIEYRLPILGTFRSLGATSFKVNLILIFESALYGLFGGLVGVLVGDVLRRILRKSYLFLDETKLNIKYALVIVAFGVILNILITIITSTKASKKSIKELIFNTQNTAREYPTYLGIIGILLFLSSFGLSYINTKLKIELLILELFLAVIGMALFTGLFNKMFCRIIKKPVKDIFKGPPWMGVANQETSRINNGTTILVSTVLSLVLIIYVSATSLGNFFDNYSNNYPYDILIKSCEKSASEYSYINMVPGVSSTVIEYWDFNNIILNDEQVHVCFVSKKGFSNGITYDAKDWTKLEDGCCIIDGMFAKIHNLKVGDVINVGEPFYFKSKIVGYCDSSIFDNDRSSIILTHNNFINYIEDSPAIIGVRVDSLSDAKKVSANLNLATIYMGDTLSIKLKDDYVGKDIKLADDTLRIVSLIPILVIILALFGLTNNQIISFYQKKKLIAVLYSTCMSKSQIKKMLFFEVFLTFISGIILGAILSFRIINTMSNIVYVVIGYFEMSISKYQILLTLSSLLILMLLSSIFPIRKLKKINVVKEIQYE